MSEIGSGENTESVNLTRLRTSYDEWAKEQMELLALEHSDFEETSYSLDFETFISQTHINKEYMSILKQHQQMAFDVANQDKSCIDRWNEYVSSISSKKRPRKIDLDEIYKLMIELRHLPVTFFMQRAGKVITTGDWNTAELEVKITKVLQRIEQLKEQNLWDNRLVKVSKRDTAHHRLLELCVERREEIVAIQVWKLKVLKKLAEEARCIYKQRFSKHPVSEINPEKKSDDGLPDGRSELFCEQEKIIQNIQIVPSNNLQNVFQSQAQIAQKKKSLFSSTEPSTKFDAVNEQKLLTDLISDFGEDNWDLIAESYASAVNYKNSLSKLKEELQERYRTTKSSSETQIIDIDWTVRAFDRFLSVFSLMKHEKSSIKGPAPRPLQKRFSVNAHMSHEMALKKAGVALFSKPPTPSELIIKRMQVQARLMNETNMMGMLRYSRPSLAGSGQTQNNVPGQQLSTVNAAPTTPRLSGPNLPSGNSSNTPLNIPRTPVQQQQGAVNRTPSSANLLSTANSTDNVQIRVSPVIQSSSKPSSASKKSTPSSDE